MILEVEHLTAKNQPSIKDVTFNLHKGEILGTPVWWGQAHRHRGDPVRHPRSQRRDQAARQEVANHNAHEAIQNGFALVTEERRSTGIYSRLDIAFNS